MTEPLLCVALNHGLGGTPPAEGWNNAELKLKNLTEWIRQGRRWVGCHLRDGYRDSGHYITSNLLVVDVDGDVDLQQFQEISFVQRHCLATLTTRSHGSTAKQQEKGTPSNSFFRALFLLDHRLTAEQDGYDLHRKLGESLLNHLGISIHDTSGLSAVMPWRGNPHVQLWHGGGEPLPWDWLNMAEDELLAERKVRQERHIPEGGEAPDAAIAWALDRVLRVSNDGERTTYWLDVFTAAAATKSEQVWTAFKGWHQRGHHGTKKHNLKGIERDFWRPRTGMNKSRGGIIAIADKQKPAWRDSLPPELRWGSRSAQSRSILMVERDLDGEPGAAVSFSGEASTVLSSGDSSTGLLSVSVTPADANREDRRRRNRESQTAEPSIELDIHELLRQLYWLEVEWRYQGVVLKEADAARKALWIQGLLMEKSPVIARNPKRIEEELLRIFEAEHEIHTPSRLAMHPRSLLEYPDVEQPPVLEGLINQGETYLLHGKAGTGKTMLLLALARSVIGVPGHASFLGYPTPPNTYGNSRVMVISTDSGEAAIPTLRRYMKWLKIRETDHWSREYLKFLGPSQDLGVSEWRFRLYDIHKLSLWLDQAIAAGKPYRLLIIDSLKSVLPPSFRVGDQVISEYIRVVRAICSTRKCAVLFIHHTSKESNTPQGVAALEEMTSGNFYIREDEQTKEHVFKITKTRAEMRGNCEISYRYEQGALIGSNDNQDNKGTRANDGRDLLIRFLDTHERNWTEEARANGETTLGYVGPARSALPDMLRKAGIDHPSWTSKRRIDALIQTLLDEGTLIRRGAGRISGIQIVRNPEMETTANFEFNDLPDEETF